MSIEPLDPHGLIEGGRLALEQIARYWDRLLAEDPSLPVRSPAEPGSIGRSMPERAPEAGEGDWAAMLEDVRRIVEPGLTHWQHPQFYGFFPANISTPAVVGELLSAGLGVQGMLWATSPACTEVETRVLDWLAGAMGLPESFTSRGGNGGGVIQGTASEATLAALCAGRARARRAWRAAGRAGAPHLTLYASTQAHSSVVKAAMVAGLADDAEDRTHVRLIDTDRATHAMRADVLEAAMREDARAGRVPAFVCATVGTTGSTAIDPVDAAAAAIARVGAEAGGAGAGLAAAWLHVDAAHAGACLICPELRWMARGVEHADSICFNPHKWLLTSFDCDCFWTRDRASLNAAMSITPEYLRTAQSDAGRVIDYRDWHVPLGRRFRALKLWLVLRHFGLERLREYVREHIRLAAWLETQVAGDARFELAAPRTMNLVCFRLRGRPDADTRGVMERLNASGRMFLTHTMLPDAAGTMRYTIRVCVGASTTREAHVRQAWAWIQEAASRER